MCLLVLPVGQSNDNVIIIGAVDKYGRTPLGVAARSGRLKTDSTTEKGKPVLVVLMAFPTPTTLRL